MTLSGNAFARSRDDFRQAFEALLRLMETYPVSHRERSGVSGWWSPRQVMNHFSGWMEEAERRYNMFDAGIPGDMTYHHDAFNATSIQARDHNSWAEALAELRERFYTLMRRASELAPEKALRDRRYREWLEGLADDCQRHLPELRAFLEADAANSAASSAPTGN